MKSTNAVLSAILAPEDSALMTSNCLPHRPPQTKVSSNEKTRPRDPPKRTTMVEQSTPKNKFRPSYDTRTNGSRYLKGRTSLRPTQIRPAQSPGSRVVLQRIASPETARRHSWGRSSTLLAQAKEPSFPSLVELQHVAPDLASSVSIQERVNELLVQDHQRAQKRTERMQKAAVSVSSLVVSDLLSASVRHGLPQKIIAKGIRRLKRKEDVMLQPTTLQKRKRRRRLSLRHSTFNKVCGIPNLGGQSCFLNSVLQALASLPPFLVYLERIVQVQYKCEDLDKTLLKDAACGSDSLSLCECLLKNLRHLNGAAEQLDPREILYRVGTKHAQFRPRHGGLGRLNVGTEQQDAQELLQALLGMIISEAGLDSSSSECKETPTEKCQQALATPRDFSFEKSTYIDEEEEDSVLSLSSFLTRIDLEQKAASAKHSCREGSQTSLSQEEEKKLDDSEVMKELTLTTYASSRSNQERKDSLQHLSASTLNMLKTLSPTTPSPLSGWIGSTLQCCTCHHVRPIQNAPFLDIPIVPASVSKYLSSRSRSTTPSSPFPACSLNQCLRDFTAVERVGDVECRSCTIKQEIAVLEEEILMLRGAVETLSARSQRSNSQDNQCNAIRAELETATVKYARLLKMDPDSECDVSQIVGDKDAFNFEHGDCLGGSDSPRRSLVRGEKKKCLLLTRIPSVLCLHVQRRYFDPARECMTKTSQHVDFPEFLDLGLHCAYASSGGMGFTGRGESNNFEKGQQRHKPIPYKLMSVIEHRGNAHAGHYQTYRRAPSNARSEWVLVSDLSVTPLSWKDVRCCQAYMLFYEAM